MEQWFKNVFRLGLKEFTSLSRDRVMVVLIIYSFSIAIVAVANGVQTDVKNATIAFVDNDRSVLSARLRDAFLEPIFKPVVVVDAADVGRLMDAGEYTFVVNIPPRFEADVLNNRNPGVLINTDATAMTQAGVGSGYIQTILMDEVNLFLDESGKSAPKPPINAVIRAFFNPNMDAVWFTSVMQIINNLTILTIILVGAAVIREREHGTIEHLLVMPVRASEIAFAKIWANSVVVLAAAIAALFFVVEIFMNVPVAGSKVLFMFGAGIYMFAVTSLGVLLATVARSMPQFGLLSIPVFVTMIMLSGTMTPMESMPVWLQTVMQAVPSTHFVAFAQAVLYRGADLFIVWPRILIMAGIGIAILFIALSRFKAMLASQA
ncbi:MAG: ABC transporter permease [Stappiaceae bacterium]